MTNDTDDDVRELYTEIGCIMEDASLIALLWRAEDGLDVAARYREMSNAHAKIGEFLLQINVIAKDQG